MFEQDIEEPPEHQGAWLTTQIEEDQTAAALRGTRASTNNVGEAGIIVGEDIVGTAIGEFL